MLACYGGLTLRRDTGDGSAPSGRRELISDFINGDAENQQRAGITALGGRRDYPGKRAQSLQAAGMRMQRSHGKPLFQTTLIKASVK